MSGREDVIVDDAYAGDTHDGIMTRSVHYLYAQMGKKSDAKYQLSASYLEVGGRAGGRRRGARGWQRWRWGALPCLPW